MALPKRFIFITFIATALGIGAIILMTSGSAISAADRRLIDRHEDALGRCFADHLPMTEKAMACVESSRIREQFSARGLCVDISEDQSGYRSISRSCLGSGRNWLAA